MNNSYKKIDNKKDNFRKKVVTKYKLKKKWRFWRVFKRFFLGRKKKALFTKLTWGFNQKRVIKHQILGLYGKKIYKLIQKKNTKVAFGKCFFKFLILLEMRFSILLTRIHFCLSNLEAIELIKTGNFLINGRKKKSNTLVRVGDVIEFSNYGKNKVSFISTTLNYDVKYRRKRRIKSYRKQKISKYISHLEQLNIRKKKQRFFWKLQKNLLVNCLEINYRIRSCILLRNPISGEILLQMSKKPLKLIKLNILKKVYFLY